MDKSKADFSGWATRNDLECSDGRTIRHNAFKECDGKTVPLVWNHQHNTPDNILGHALLENRSDGVYAYCFFNETESAKAARLLVKHGDIVALSIFANQLKQQGGNVLHGTIREVSLVPAGANPGAFIDYVMAHGDDGDEAIILSPGEPLSLSHSDGGAEKAGDKKEDKPSEKDGDKPSEEEDDGETIEDVVNSMTEKQKKVMYALVGAALSSDGEKPEDKEKDNDDSEGGDKTMKHNVFEGEDTRDSRSVLSHADQQEIIALAKNKSVGSFQQALQIYVEENKDTLAHGIDDIEQLFPDYEWTKPGAPETITRDMTWVDHVLNKVSKSPISRVRMRWADLREEDIRAMGYKKGTEKKLIGSFKLLNRTFDPQTVYVKDKLERDDVVDITDFDVVEYMRKIMRMALNETLAIAIMIGDGKEEGADGKIYESHIRSIWNDDELFTIHADVDIEAARNELQGTNTGANFGENYIYAEAIIAAALYAREKYKGSGSLTYYCTPHMLNVMLLARDLNGRRIYDSKTDLAAALNVTEIFTVEQFEGKTRTTEAGKVKKLLGLFVNVADYQLGSTKNGQITNFEDFDIDFNQYKYLMETRLSGALTRVFSAIALEQDVTPAKLVAPSGGDGQ